MSLQLVSLEPFDHLQITSFWNRALSGHGSNLQKKPAAMALHLKQGNADRKNSLVMLDGDRFAGLSLLGRRGGRAEIMGFGIDPHYRGRALARRLIKAHVERVKKLDIDELGLEVLDENEAARRAYEAAGFRPLRDVSIFWGAPELADPLSHLVAVSQAAQLPLSEAPPESVREHRPRLSGKFFPSFERTYEFWRADPRPTRVRIAGSADTPEALMVTRLWEGKLELVDAIGSRAGLAALLAETMVAHQGAYEELICNEESLCSPLAALLTEIGVPEKHRYTEMLICN